MWGSTKIGIMSLKTRRDMADLIYLWKLQNLGKHRLERQLYDWLLNDTAGVLKSKTLWETIEVISDCIST